MKQTVKVKQVSKDPSVFAGLYRVPAHVVVLAVGEGMHVGESETDCESSKGESQKVKYGSFEDPFALHVFANTRYKRTCAARTACRPGQAKAGYAWSHVKWASAGAIEMWPAVAR